MEWGTLLRRKDLIGYLFILPAAVFHVVFILYPIVQTGILSLYKWDGANPVKEFVGLGHYLRIFTSRLFWISLSHNIIWVVWHIAVPATLGLFLAVLVSSIKRGQNIYRVIFFMPAVLSLVVVGIIWGWIYNPTWGALNSFLKVIDLGYLARPWLGDENIALIAIMVASSWIWTGYCFVVFLAGLQEINPILYDAAKVDGANSWQRFLHVTIPGLSDVATIVYVWTVMVGLKVFDIILIMTAGGPHYATQTVANWMYEMAIGGRVHAGNEVGFGCAIAYVLGAIVVLSSIVFIKLRERGR